MNLPNNKDNSSDNMDNKNLKYNLEFYLGKAPSGNLSILKEKLEQAMKVGTQMVYYYRKVEVGESRSMSTDQLLAAAKVLNIEPCDLLSEAYLNSSKEKQAVQSTA